MEWQIIVALIIAIPIILLPVAFIWYIKIGGLYLAIKEARSKRAAAKKHTEEAIQVEVEAG